MSTPTITDIYARCIEEGDCMIWQGALTDQGYPLMKFNGKSTSVRRVVMTLDGRIPKSGQPVACSCNEKRCVAKEHLSRSTFSKISQKVADSGLYASKARCAKVAEVNRNRKDTRLSIEIARDIRTSEESGQVLADQYGVGRNRISAIRRGEIWKEYGATPFEGLGARA